MPAYDATCDPSLRSWVLSANRTGSDFPIQNLPFGVFRHRNSPLKNIGVAIGDDVLNLRGLADDDLLTGIDQRTIDACRQEALNALMVLGRIAAMELRLRLSELLRDYPPESSWKSFDRELVEQHLLAQKDVRMIVPANIGDYTDFYASIEHATRAGSLFRPDNPLLPNYKHLPIGYHGRASSIIASGTAIRRPYGQQLAEATPRFAPTKKMDFEAELGFFIGKGTALGERVLIGDAPQQLFGFCLVNDWSARDIQSWEYQPLGPFLGKSFATTISPWVVTVDALAPFRVPVRGREPKDPPLLPYLANEDDAQSGAIDLHIEVHLLTPAMRETQLPPALLSRSNGRNLYWSPAQMLTHQASNGCNLRPGDLLASGTVSGAADDARACLLEITKGGVEPIRLAHGEERAYLEDGDEIIVSGHCARPDFPRVGFGECRGVVMPSSSMEPG